MDVLDSVAVLEQLCKATKKWGMFVSAFGSNVDIQELAKAAAAGVTFITDSPYDRGRGYNIGERELAEWLKMNRYQEVEPGIWEPAV